MIPNFITGIRIVCAFLLLTVPPFSVPFLCLYGVCGISDVADGYIARKTNTTTQLGATLDSIADALFIVIALIVVMRKMEIPGVLLVWILIIAMIRMLSLGIGLIKYCAVAFLHTYANKATGFLLFCYPFVYAMTKELKIVYVICLVATLSAIEEFMIQLCSKNLKRNQKSIFSRR